MVEEFDGKKGDEKYEEDFSNSLLESFKMRGSFQLLLCGWWAARCWTRR